MARRAWAAAWLIGVALSAAVALPLRAGDAPAPVAAPALVAFASDDGLLRLARSQAKVDFALLANQFEPQSNLAFCGPTSVAIVLNALRPQAADLPRDRSRLRPDDLRSLPPGFDLTLPRYTQESVFDKSPKTRAQVLGEPVQRDGQWVSDGGFQLRQLDATLRAHGVATRMTIVDEALPEAAIRSDLLGNLQRGGDYVIVNYKRSDVGQKGGGHISPLGAYDAESDSVLVLDVNPSSAGWVWMPLSTLIRGMRSFDTLENRGYIAVTAP